MKIYTTILTLLLGASTYGQSFRPSSLSTVPSETWSLGGNILGPYGANTNNSVLTHGVVITPLLAPVVTATKYGATDSTTWQYKVSAVTGALETDAGSAQITNGSTSLTTANYVRLTWPLVTGATSYKVYRYVGGGIAQYRFIKTVYGGSYSDTGVDAYTTSTPSLVNQTGKITGATISGNADTATSAKGLVNNGVSILWDNDTRWVVSGNIDLNSNYIYAEGFVGALQGNADTATRATNLGSTSLGIPKIGASGAPASATGADVAALITGTNLSTTGTGTFGTDLTVQGAASIARLNLYESAAGVNKRNWSISNGEGDGGLYFMTSMSQGATPAIASSNVLQLDSSANIWQNATGTSGGGTFNQFAKSNFDVIFDSFKATIDRGGANGAAGLGLGYLFSIENGGGARSDAGRFTYSWSDATAGAEQSSFGIQTKQAGALAERVTVRGLNVGIGTTAPTSKLQVIGLPVYANNAAALAGGLTAGAFYRTGADPDPVCVVH